MKECVKDLILVGGGGWNIIYVGGIYKKKNIVDKLDWVYFKSTQCDSWGLWITKIIPHNSEL